MSMYRNFPARIMRSWCLAAFWVRATCGFVACAMPIAVAAADPAPGAEDLQNTVRDLRVQVEALRNDLRNPAVTRMEGQNSAADGTRGSAAPSQPGSAYRPNAPSRPQPSSASRYRRGNLERPPYRVGPADLQPGPYYNAPVFVYPYNYHLGTPFYPNNVIANPYQGLWFNR